MAAYIAKDWDEDIENISLVSNVLKVNISIN